MHNIYLSIVIPTYNEELRIGKTLDAVTSYVRTNKDAYEIIISDDGSQDSTVDVVRGKLTDYCHRILTASQNEGKGSAVKKGMLAATGEFVLFTDADLSTPIEEVDGFIKSLESGYDVVIGSRGLSESRVEIRQNFLREAMGKGFNRLAKVFAFHGIQDSQCGFKCFKREIAQDLFGRQKLSGFSFDAEILYLAQRRGYRILEAPVTWRNSAQSRVKILSDPIDMFKDLFRVRWLHRDEK